jgi:hypothetical protein
VIDIETALRGCAVKKCKGTIWRYSENGFINTKGEIVFRKRVRKLKRKCCNGACQPSRYACESEFVNEIISDFFSDSGHLPELPDGVRDGDELILRFDADEGSIDGVWFERVAP